MKNTLDTTETPSRDLMISKAGRIVSAVVCTPRESDALLELARVDGRFEYPECGRDLPLVFGADDRAHRLHRIRCKVQGLRRRHDRKRRALEQAPNCLAELVATRDEHPRDGRN